MNDSNTPLVSHVSRQLWQSRFPLSGAIIALAILLAVPLGFWPKFLFGCLTLVLLVAAIIRRLTNHTAGLEKNTSSETRLLDMSGERLAERLSDPIIIFDPHGSVLYANRAALDAFQPLEKDAVLYLRFRAPEMHALIQGVIADGRTRSIDYFERLPIDRWYKATVMVLADDAARSKFYMLVFKDQTESRSIDRMRSDFIANASHELRTPLASLRGFIETLQGPARNDAAARERFLEIMQKQAERMSRLIDDLLSLSRLEMRAHLAVTEIVDLTAVLNHVADTLTSLAAGQGVTIERQLPDNPVQVVGARDELIQLFQNLVENACKYGQLGQRIIVALEVQQTDETAEAVATVQDFGPGIAGEYLPRLTERFYRIDVETSRSQKGTGLGLAIVKHILTRHRGRLVVRSQLGEGSSFIVRLKLAPNRASV